MFRILLICFCSMKITGMKGLNDTKLIRITKSDKYFVVNGKKGEMKVKHAI